MLLKCTEAVCVCVCDVQGLDGAQRGEQAFADGLKLVVIEREQIETLQVLECVHPQAVDLVGVKQPVWTKRRFILQSELPCVRVHNKPRSLSVIDQMYYSPFRLNPSFELCFSIY